MSDSSTSFVDLRVADFMTRQSLSLPPDATLRSAVLLMAERHISCVPVVADGAAVGILTERDILRLLERGESQDVALAEVMSRPAQTVRDDLDFRSAYAQLRRLGIRHLIVVDKAGAVAGIVSETDFRNHLGREFFGRIRSLSSTIDRDILCLPLRTPLATATRRMLDAKRDYAVIVDAGRPAGIITERDIPRLMARNIDPSRLVVADVMSSPVRTVAIDAQPGDVIDRMVGLRIRHLVVVDSEGGVAGVLTQNRLLELLGIEMIEDAWRASEQQYRLLVHTIREIVYRMDVRGWLAYLNPAWFEALGIEHSLAIGRPLSDFLCAEDRNLFADTLDALAHGRRGEFNLELRFRHADGDHRWFETFGRATYDAHGQMLGIFGTLFDITERIVATDRLIVANAAAQAASQAKSRFLAVMSHEIRTPLNGILGMAQLLLMNDASATEREQWARTIIDSGRSLARLVSDVLDISALESGALGLSRVAAFPRALIEQVAESFARMAQAKGLTIEIACSVPDDGCYELDSARLRQMLACLIDNAIRHTERGFVRIEAAETGIEGNEALIEFAVSDSGCGIPVEQRATLFEPFAHAHASTTRRCSGLGLGLSLVASLARLMRGDVGVDSREGAGSRFRFQVRAPIIDYLQPS